MFAFCLYAVDNNRKGNKYMWSIQYRPVHAKLLCELPCMTSSETSACVAFCEWLLTTGLFHSLLEIFLLSASQLPMDGIYVDVSTKWYEQAVGHV